MPLQATSGAASYDAFGGGVPVEPNYIESCFSTYLYTGNSSTQTITNGIDLSTYGGLVWFKNRDNANTNNNVYDTNRGIYKYLQTNTTDPQTTNTNRLTAFNTTGFNIGNGGGDINRSPDLYVSWTFRKQPKFFDVVTYTGNGGTPQNIAHSLGSVPGFIVVKPTSITGGWICYHRSLTASGFNPAPYNTINLNSTGSILEDTGAWNSTAPTSTVFTIGSSPDVNTNGVTYVAYLFAHDAGGFGLTGTDNVISCGSFTSSGNYPQITLGYEPQWVLIKRTDSATDGDWMLADVMRPGFNANAALGNEATYILKPNTSGAETTGVIYAGPNSTGFSGYFGAGSRSFIYIAIRRGPMKVPVDANKVFAPVAYTGNGTTNTVTTGFVTDLVLGGRRNQFDEGTFDRLRGASKCLVTSSTVAEAGTIYDLNRFDIQNGFGLFENSNASLNTNGQAEISWNFRRAPQFFDEVCYTGTGSVQNITHNLGVTPEFMIVKKRSAAADWEVYQAALGATNIIELNLTGATSVSSTRWNNTAPTASVFTVGTHTTVNASGATYVAYLFATCAGVSKCTAFTGTGTLQTINCGFTSGSRFILIKRTDAAGDWYVWDSSRGLSSSTDPYLLLNSTAAEVTSTNWVDTTSTGFQVTAASGNNVNISGATYIALAIA